MRPATRLRPRARRAREREHDDAGCPARGCREGVRRPAGRRRHLARDPARLVLRAPRPVRLRQDDDPADDRRLRGGDVRADPPRRPRRRRPAAVQAGRQHGLPELRALPPHDRCRQRRVRARAEAHAEGGGQDARRRDPRARRSRRARGSQAAPALRRPAAARRARAGDREQPARAPARRAARRARPEAAQADAARAETHPERGRHHVRPRHARPGGGDDDGRHDRRHERRTDRAARDAGRALRAAAQRIRGRLPRQVEPARGDDHRRRPDPARRRLGAPRVHERLARPRLHRRAAREDQPARRGRQPALGQGEGVCVHRGRDRGRRGDAGGRDDRVPPERRGGRRRAGAGKPGDPVVGARGDVRRRSRRGAGRMTMRITRRELVQRGAAGVTILSLPGLLAACGGSSGGGGGSGEVADVLRFSNWPLYIDFDEKTKKHPTLDQFTAKTGIEVDYFEDINSNAEYFGKIQRPLSQGQSIDRDIIVLTDNERFLGLMIDKGWVEELDKDLIPNFSNLIEAQASPPFDPDRKYSLPWQSGMTGIAWNEKETGPITSITQLFEDPKLKGRVTALNGMGDTPGLVMLDNGDDPSNVTDAAWNAAVDRIQKAVDSGQIRRFTGNDYAQPLSQGDLAAAIAWSGDIFQLLSSNPNLKWALPTKGGIIWTDNMIIPTGGSVPTASTYMNFVYAPKIAAQITAYVAYVPPVKGTKEILVKSDPKIASSPLVFPSDEVLASTHQYDS